MPSGRNATSTASCSTRTLYQGLVHGVRFLTTQQKWIAHTGMAKSFMSLSMKSMETPASLAFILAYSSIWEELSKAVLLTPSFAIKIAWAAGPHLSQQPDRNSTKKEAWSVHHAKSYAVPHPSSRYAAISLQASCLHAVCRNETCAVLKSGHAAWLHIH